MLREQLLQLFLVHSGVGVTVTDQQTQRVVLQLPKVDSSYVCTAIHPQQSAASAPPGSYSVQPACNLRFDIVAMTAALLWAFCIRLLSPCSH